MRRVGGAASAPVARIRLGPRVSGGVCLAALAGVGAGSVTAVGYGIAVRSCMRVGVCMRDAGGLVGPCGAPRDCLQLCEWAVATAMGNVG